MFPFIHVIISTCSGRSKFIYNIQI
jgi:hypothetical protein